jgi:hypothetical protein
MKRVRSFIFNNYIIRGSSLVDLLLIGLDDLPRLGAQLSRIVPIHYVYQVHVHSLSGQHVVLQDGDLDPHVGR